MSYKLNAILALAVLAALAGCAQQRDFLLGRPVAQHLPAAVEAARNPPVRTAARVAPDVERTAFVEEAVPPTPPEELPAAKPQELQSGSAAISLPEFEDMALANNPSLARSTALVQAAQGNYVQVGLPPNPTVAYQGQQIGSRGLAEQDGVVVSQEIVRGGKLKLNRQVAAQDWARAENELAAQQQRVLTDVRVAFYQVLIAERQEKLTNELLGVARQTLQVAEKLLQGKEVGRVDVVQAQLELENMEILARNAQNRSVAAWQNLGTVVGNPRLPRQPITGDAEESRGTYTWEDSLQKILTTSPEIAVAMTNVERARWAVQRALVEKTPNVTVDGLVNWRDNGIGGRSDGALLIGVPLPLWNRNQGGVMQAQSQVVAAERALEQLELSLQNRFAPVYERYKNALNQVEKYRTKILPAAKDSLDLTRKLYEGGESGYINLLTAQRTYSQTNLNYLESLRELRRAEAEIEGLLLSGSLESK